MSNEPGSKSSPDKVDGVIAQWAREIPELDTRAMELFGRIHRVSDQVRARMRGIHAEFGLRQGEFDVLATLRRSGEPYRLSPTDLARSMLLTTGGMTQRLDRLESAGWVTRVARPRDKRGVDAQLTPAGRELVDRAVRRGVAEELLIVDLLGADACRDLSDRLRDLLAQVDRSFS